jgi:hypothetical protein
MVAMRPFFSVAVRHDFFVDGRTAVQWQPTQSTQRLLEASGCAVAPGRSDLEVFYDSDRRSQLQMYLADSRAPFKLTWRWHLPGFDLDSISAGASTTAPARSGSVLFLTSRRAVQDADTGDWRLHADKQAGSRDWRASGTQRLRPRPVVRLHLGAADLPAPDAKQGRRYSIRIGARATYWKYFLPAQWPAASVHVVDSAGQVEFSPATASQLADGRPALCVRSRGPIALRQRPAESFQLTCVEDGIERVVVERLPAAAPGSYVRETVEGGMHAVSEIHV